MRVNRELSAPLGGRYRVGHVGPLREAHVLQVVQRHLLGEPEGHLPPVNRPRVPVNHQHVNVSQIPKHSQFGFATEFVE